MVIPYYEFSTYWEIKAPQEMLYDLLSVPARYPEWMESLNIQVSPVREGDRNGIGREDHYQMRAFLPYTLRWNLKCIQTERPRQFLSEASGDLEGTGKWIFQHSGDTTRVIFEWKVRTRKPFVRNFSWLLRPVFQWNHDWVMKPGKRIFAGKCSGCSAINGKRFNGIFAGVKRRSNLLVPD